MEPFAPFEAAPVVAVAVSGGRDSLCLALLAKAWAVASGGHAVGLVVDHGLRAEAAAEAWATREALVRHGLEAEILTWSGVKPSTGLQEAARAARYRLLGEECRRRGILHLLLGHQADDQVETVAMRAARGSGDDGLAGMAALVEQPQMRLLRPLLGVPRARLTATLLARGVKWIDDPSNSDPRFERARLRALPRAHVEPSGEAHGRAARERTLARAAVVVLELDEPGTVAIDQTRFAYLDDGLQARLLSRVVQSLGGRDHPPRRDRLQRAVRRLAEPMDRSTDRGKSGRSRDFTLSGCKLSLRQVSESSRLRWIAQPEHGKNVGRPLIPATFFACSACADSHLECAAISTDKACEPVQP